MHKTRLIVSAIFFFNLNNLTPVAEMSLFVFYLCLSVYLVALLQTDASD